MTEVIIGERVTRVKRKLAKCRKLKTEILKQPPTFRRSRKVKVLNDKIKEYETYLETAK